MVAIDTAFVLQAGALVLLALGSGLVLRLVTWADTEGERPRVSSRPRSVAEAADTMRRAA